VAVTEFSNRFVTGQHYPLVTQHGPTHVDVMWAYKAHLQTYS